MFRNLEGKKYDVVYADPPWDYKGQKQHNGKGGADTGGAETHYSTVTTKDMMKWPVSDVCNTDCLMFMWITSPHLDQGLALLEAWGFEYKTVAFVWNKDKVNPGFYTMSSVELCVVAKRKRGKIPQPRGARNIKQFLQHDRMAHSKKPYEIANRISQMFPDQAKLEMFARNSRDGWDVWGNEV